MQKYLMATVQKYFRNITTKQFSYFCQHFSYSCLYSQPKLVLNSIVVYKSGQIFCNFCH